MKTKMLIILKENFISSYLSTFKKFFPPFLFLLTIKYNNNFNYFPQFPQTLLLLYKFIIGNFSIRKIENLKEKILIAIIKKIALVCK